jgi:hypothetical protein
VALVHWTLQSDRRCRCRPRASEHAAGSANPSAIEPMADRRRLEVLIRLLEHRAVGAAIRQQVGALLAECQGVRLFAETGLGNDRGAAERDHRPAVRPPVDPHPATTTICTACCSVCFPTKKHLNYLDRISRAASAVCTPPCWGARGGAGRRHKEAPLFTRLQGAVTDAWVLISARLQGLGLSHAIRERSRPLPLSESPFFRLPRASGSRAGQPGQQCPSCDCGPAERRASGGRRPRAAGRN